MSYADMVIADGAVAYWRLADDTEFFNDDLNLVSINSGDVQVSDAFTINNGELFDLTVVMTGGGSITPFLVSNGSYTEFFEGGSLGADGTPQRFRGTWGGGTYATAYFMFRHLSGSNTITSGSFSLSTSTILEAVGSLEGTATAGLLMRQPGPAVIADSYSIEFANSVIEFEAIGLPTPTGLPDGNDDRTIEGWIKTTTGSQMCWFGYGNADVDQQYVGLLNYLDDVGLSMYSSDFAKPVTADAHIDGNWHHIVITYKGSTRTIEWWFDAGSLGTQILGSDRITALTSARIGSLYYASGFAFTGNLSEIAVYPSVLSPGQIAAHAAGDPESGGIAVYFLAAP